MESKDDTAHEGPKRGLTIHFLPLGELREMLDRGVAAVLTHAQFDRRRE